MKKIKVIVKRPLDIVGHEDRIPNDDKVISEIVGGNIETIFLSKDIVVLCNEDGKLLGLPHNLDLKKVRLVGTLIFAGINDQGYTDYPGDINHFRKHILGGDL